MKKLPKVALGIILLLAVVSSIGLREALAAELDSVGIATYLPVNGKVEDGDIISSTPKGHAVSNKPYDPQIVGVMSSKPAIGLKVDVQQKGVAVVNVGTALVKVSGVNGNIKKGDFIAASAIPGTGMRASRSGYVLGEALQDVSFGNTKEIKKIAVTLNTHFLQFGNPINNSLLQIFALSSLATYEEPLRVFKYVISAIVLIISFTFGFVIFSRTINTGMEALGRNPLAGRMIQLSILFNVILVIIIITTAIGIVWLFLRL